MAEENNPFAKPLPQITPTTEPYWRGLREEVVKATVLFLLFQAHLLSTNALSRLFVSRTGMA